MCLKNRDLFAGPRVEVEQLPSSVCRLDDPAVRAPVEVVDRGGVPHAAPDLEAASEANGTGSQEGDHNSCRMQWHSSITVAGSGEELYLRKGAPLDLGITVGGIKDVDGLIVRCGGKVAPAGGELELVNRRGCSLGPENLPHCWVELQDLSVASQVGIKCHESIWTSWWAE